MESVDPIPAHGPLTPTAGGSTPVPDPTERTRQELYSAVGNIQSKIADVQAFLVAEVHHRGELSDEKFKAIEEKFIQAAERTAEQKQDTKNALDAALAAQKEAVANQTVSSEKSITKSETATVERIKATEALLTTNSKATDDKIADLKDRLTAIESIKLGSVEGSASVRQSNAALYALVGFVLTVMTIGAAIAGLIAAKPN